MSTPDAEKPKERRSWGPSIRFEFPDVVGVLSVAVVFSWLAIAVFASGSLMVLLLLERPIPDLNIVKEIIQILSAPAFAILTFYFSSRTKGSDDS
jgi:hypothetical protein|tara:strand:+ start:21085 stop:21369 length:285 start_codon:yes stop_codon:yes gene_type:complete